MADPSTSARSVQAAAAATYVAFIASGFAFASWASRIPQVRDALHLDAAELGLVLLAIAVGSIVAMPASGPLVTRYGSRRAVRLMSLLLAAGLVLASVGYLVGVVPLVVGLLLVGLGNGSWDVAMNVQGALVERRLGRSIMPRFHAGYSVGTVAGALTGTAMVALDMPVTVHLLGVAALVALVVPSAARRFLADAASASAGSAAPGVTAAPGAAVGHVAPAAAATAPNPSSLSAWAEPRTLLVGVFVMAFAFAEGTGNDWIGIAVIDGYSAPPVVATLAFAVFLAAMTAGRWVGPALLDRYGRVPVVRGLTVLSLVGLLVFVFGPSIPVAFLGALLWGAGTSLGFPVGMSAGADDPARAAARVSVIASIGYCAFLAGPPLIGFLGQSFSVLRALTAVAALLAIAALVASSVGPIPEGSSIDAASRS